MAWTYLMEGTMPVPGERPICHYSGEQCKQEGAACTCLLPNFQGTPPTYASDAMRAELDKCDGLTADEKEYLLRIAFAGLEYAKKLQAARGVDVPRGDGDYYSEEAADIAESKARNAGVKGTMSDAEFLKSVEGLGPVLGPDSPDSFTTTAAGVPATSNDQGENHG